MSRIRSAAALLFVLLLTACGQAASNGLGGTGGPGRAGSPSADPAGEGARPVRDWSGFPVTSTPRPIVLIGQRDIVEGYTTNEAKLAYGAGKIELAVTPPAGPATVLVHLADGDATLPTVTAAEAFEAMHAVALRPEVKPQPGVPPLRLTAVSFGTARFYTDRGRIPLPAWLFDGPELLGPIAWPALDPSAFWQFGQERYPLGGLGENRLATDGVTLTVTLPNPPCPGRPVITFEPVVAETDITVMVGVREVAGTTAPGTPGDCVLDLVLRTTQYTVQLAAPLGNRVLIDERGDALPVTLS